jgi:hypothetical protein
MIVHTKPMRDANHYHNCRVLSPEGDLMFRCNEDKVQWYLDRDLAEKLGDDPLTIRFNFRPAGRGHAGNAFYLQEKANRCVACGVNDLLTKHHCVPQVFRKHFPLEYKSHAWHDVLLLCTDCHDRYELDAHEFKKEILISYGVEAPGSELGKEVGSGSDVFRDWYHATSSAHALLRYKDTIPADKLVYLERQVKAHLNKDTLTEADLLAVCAQREECKKRMSEEAQYGKAVVDLIEDIPAFIRLWREHFVSVMSPKYLPKFWRVDHDDAALRTMSFNSPA